MTSVGSGDPVLTVTIWTGEPVGSGDWDLNEFGVVTLEREVRLRGEMALSGQNTPSGDGELLDFTLGGDMDEFWMMVILCLGGAPLVGMTAVLV